MRWLTQRDRCWYAVRDVPRPLRAVLGKKRLLKSLDTRDIHVALARRHAALAEFQRVFDAALSQGRASPIMTSAMEWREIRAREPHDDAVAEYILDEAERIEETHGLETARDFYDMALGKVTPLLHYVDAWLAEGGTRGPVAARTQRQYRSDLRDLEAWAIKSGISPAIEAFSKAVAGRYVTEGLLGNGVDRKTANRKISAASAYWRWLVKRTSVETNPWAGQSLAKGAPATDGEKPKRAFTTAEALALLNGDADPELADAMRMAALTGMRVEELYRLTVADCAAGWFHVRCSKTRAGVRRVPTHSGLVALVERRTRGKQERDFLFHEAGPLREGRERSMAVSKRFGHYRKRLGVDDRAKGRRQSRTDFHSWRRGFVTEARNAGIDRAVVAAVVGHEAGNLTDDTYSAGPSDDLKRACVEAVRLPSGTRNDTSTPPPRVATRVNRAARRPAML